MRGAGGIGKRAVGGTWERRDSAGGPVGEEAADFTFGENPRRVEAFELNDNASARANTIGETGLTGFVRNSIRTGAMHIQHGTRARKPGIWSGSPNEVGVGGGSSGGSWGANGTGSKQSCQSAERLPTK